MSEPTAFIASSSGDHGKDNTLADGALEAVGALVATGRFLEGVDLVLKQRAPPISGIARGADGDEQEGLTLAQAGCSGALGKQWQVSSWLSQLLPSRGLSSHAANHNDKTPFTHTSGQQM